MHQNAYSILTEPLFYGAFAAGGIALILLRYSAEAELVEANKLCVGPGWRIWDVAVAGESLLEPRNRHAARYFNLVCFSRSLVSEPSLFAWCIGAWMVLLQEWSIAGWWLGSAAVWRVLWDLQFPVDGAPLGKRFQRLGVKLVWCLASAVFFIAIVHWVATLLMMLLCVCGVAKVGRSRRNQRWV